MELWSRAQMPGISLLMPARIKVWIVRGITNWKHSGGTKPRVVDPSWNRPLIYVIPVTMTLTDIGDLSRYIAGDVNLPTVRAVAVEHDDLPGKLSSIPANVNESEIPEKDRLPRVTSALW